MSRLINLAFVAFGVFMSSTALAQPAPDAPRVTITLSPAGFNSFTQTNGASHFTNDRLGAAVAVNLTPVVGLEGELGASLGREQSLLIPMPDPHPSHHLPPMMGMAKSPNVLDYSLNLVVAVPTAKGLTPYVTGGAGGLSLLQRREVLVTNNETFLSVNAGAGLKWSSTNGRWGLRGDYRVIAIPANDEASSFFGMEQRYAHRVYAGVFVGIGR